MSREEQTEDLEKFMAISGGVEDKPYLEVPAFIHFRKRVFWVVILAFMSLVSGLIIQHFQKTLETLLVLTFYMPLLNATGGNTGSQSATVVLRALTLKELSVKDILGVVRKEFRVSSMLSLCLGIITFGRVYLLSSHSIPAQFTLFGVASVRSEMKLDLIIRLHRPDPSIEDDRTGLARQTREVLGVQIPLITIPVAAGRDLAHVVEVAALNERLKQLGHDAAKELDEKLVLTLTQKKAL